MGTRHQCEALERRTLLAAAPWEPILKNDFSDVSDMTLNGSATNQDAEGNPTDRLTLTDAVEGQAGSSFFNDRRRMRFFDLPVMNGFTAEFDFVVTPGGPDPAEGFFFVLHNDPRGPEALGAGGPGMGWEGIENSVGVKFDFNTGGADQTGLYVGGAAVSRDVADPRNRALPDRLDLDSGQTLHVSLSYDINAGVMSQLVWDPAARFEPSVTTYAVDIPAVVGEEQAYIGFAGATGTGTPDGGVARQQVLNFRYNLFHVDYFGARVTQAFVNGPGLPGQTTANGQAFRSIAGVDNTYGFPVPAGANQLKSIPWIGGIDRVALRFDRDVGGQLGQNDLVVRGVNRATYAVNGFSYDPATRTGVWTLAERVTNDRLRIVLDDAGVPDLDGDWRNGSPGQSYPSGDGAPGGDFDFRVNVLAGDATQDGQVNALDLSITRQKLNKSATNPGSGGGAYSVFADLTADGQINALDLSAARQRLNNRLPGGEPAALLGR